MAEHDTLRRAWRRYSAYDAASIASQRRFLWLRLAILIIGVLAAAGGLASRAACEAAADAGPAIPSEIRWLTFGASLVLTGLLAAAARFDPGRTWVLSRHSAELVLREIFLYRTGRGPYKAAPEASATPDEVLAAQLHAISSATPQRLALAAQDSFEPRVVRTADNRPMVLAGGGTDDGLCRLGPDDYVHMRIEDQRAWYGTKARRLRARLLGFHVAGITIGLGGAVLTAVDGPWIAWVAVTTTVAAAIASWTELRRLEQTAAAYEHAESDLDDLLVWWSSLGKAGQSLEDNFDKLVVACEAAIESENASWTQDMRKRIAELRAEAEHRVVAGKPE